MSVVGSQPADTSQSSHSTGAVSVLMLRCLSGHAPAETTDELAQEEPLEIRVNGTSVAVTMRTPGHDPELAAGFLLSEAMVRNGAEIAGIRHCNEPGAKNVIDVFLNGAVDLGRLTRHVFASSSCGVCGKASIEAIHQNFPPLVSRGTVPAGVISMLPHRMREAQAVFAQTGGLHAAAVFDGTGGLGVVREDVGRHNAVDKVLGFGVLKGCIPYNAHILLVSGRASFEIVQKALSAQIPVVCAVSAPSSLAVEFARKSGQTLVGFLRDGRMNVYTGKDRIVWA